MFTILQSDGVIFQALEPSKPTVFARHIFMWLVTHVQKNAPDSILLRAVTTPLTSPVQLQNGRFLDICDKLNQGYQPGCDELIAVPDHLLTLALIPENFQSALVYTMEAYAADPSKPNEQMKEAVEALMYRLAIKDPKAFPKAFSLVGAPAGEEEGE